MTILGIDPGTTRLGFGIVKKDKEALVHVESGTILTSSKNLSGRLKEIEVELSFLIKKHRPSLLAIEKIYFSKNQKTALEVAHARGVVMLKAAEFEIPCLEIAPTEVKLAVAGSGRASKKSVAKMVGFFLDVETEGVLDDTTDALAVAISASTLYKYRFLEN